MVLGSVGESITYAHSEGVRICTRPFLRKKEFGFVVKQETFVTGVARYTVVPRLAQGYVLDPTAIVDNLRSSDHINFIIYI